MTYNRASEQLRKQKFELTKDFLTSPVSWVRYKLCISSILWTFNPVTMRPNCTWNWWNKPSIEAAGVVSMLNSLLYNSPVITLHAVGGFLMTTAHFEHERRWKCSRQIMTQAGEKEISTTYYTCVKHLPFQQFWVSGGQPLPFTHHIQVQQQGTVSLTIIHDDKLQQNCLHNWFSVRKSCWLSVRK